MSNCPGVSYCLIGPSLAIESVHISIVSPSSVNILWIPPPRESWNGILTNYTVISHSHGPNNISVSRDLELHLANDTLVGFTSKEYLIEENNPDPRFLYTALVPEELTIEALNEFFTYEFTLYVSNSVGDSDPVSSPTIQLPGVGKSNMP